MYTFHKLSLNSGYINLLQVLKHDSPKDLKMKHALQSLLRFSYISFIEPPG